MGLFHLALLPLIERQPDGPLPRTSGRQRLRAVTLIHKLCSACDNGHCLYLDGGEEVPCPQTLSYSVCCKFFRWVLLKDGAGQALETELFGKDTMKQCAHSAPAKSGFIAGIYSFSIACGCFL